MMVGGNKQLSEKFDVVVVGSGLGGLTCALELARNGYKVCVVEKHISPGGYAHSFHRSGFTFDVSLHHFGGLSEGNSIHGVLKTLGVLEKIKYRLNKNIMCAKLPDGEYTISNKPGAFEHFLKIKFPHEAENIDSLISHLKDLRWHIIGGWIDPDFDVPLEELLTGRYLDKTFHDLLTEFIQDEKLIAFFSQFWMFIGLPPKLVNATFSTCVCNSHFFEGTYDIDGGGAALSRAYVSRLLELGSQCILNSEVKKITVVNGAATGVELKDGVVIEADIVVSNSDPYQTFFNLVDKTHTSDLFRFRLEKMERSVSLYSMYIGLDCPPSKLGIPDTTYFYNHTFEPLKSYANIVKGNVESTDWCCTNYENSMINKCPQGHYAVTFVELTAASDWLDLDNDSYAQKKEEIKNRLLDKYAARFPGLKDHIKVLEFATPRTMNRYSSNFGGSVYGLAQNVEQSASKRLRNVTPVENLYLTGSWTWSGGGYEGAIMSGIQTAASIKKKWGSKNNALPIHVKRAKSSLRKGEYEKDVRIYNKDISAGGIADANCFLRMMDRARVDGGERLFNLELGTSLFDRYNIQVYSIHLKIFSRSFSGEKLTVLTKNYRKSDFRILAHQTVKNKETGKTVTDAAVELVCLDKDGVLIGVPPEIDKPFVQNSEFDSSAFLPSNRNERNVFNHYIRVYTEDTDLQGVTFHASYLRFCEETFFEFLDKQTKGKRGWDYWVFSDFYIRFLNAALVGNMLDITMAVHETANGEFIFHQKLNLREQRKMATEVFFKVDLFDKRGNQISLKNIL
jgi:YbgC/YbaW family acyl-CoA thioester hydrolase